MNETPKTITEIASRTKVRIVNETGRGQDTKVYIDDKLMPNVISVELGKVDAETDFVTAKIEFLGVKLDLVGVKNE